MAGDLPEYYFRTRDNGALVFRIDTANRQQRIEMEQIAAANVKTGEIRPQGERVLTDADRVAIEAWIADRRAVLAEREIDDILRAVDHLNQVAHWAQARASDGDLERVTDPLLLAMHDLRAVLVRKKAERPDRG